MPKFRQWHRMTGPGSGGPWRCHPVKVPGRTEIKALQSNSLAAKAIETRVASSSPSRSHVRFLVEGQLFPQEEILSSQAGSESEGGAQESEKPKLR